MAIFDRKEITILGVNFLLGGVGAEILEKQGRKIRHQNSLRNSPAIFLIFAGPKQKIHPKSALQNLGRKILSGVYKGLLWPKKIASCDGCVLLIVSRSRAVCIYIYIYAEIVQH